MLPRVSFEHAAQSLMDAAVDPTRWSVATDALANYASATGVVILPVKGRCPGTPHSASLGEGIETYFRDGWHLRDERNRGLPLIKRKGIFVDQDFAGQAELATSDYYRGFLAKFGANWSAVVGFTDPDEEWCLVFERGDRQGFFDQREQDDLVRFAAPLRSAAALARSVAYTNAAGAMDAYQSIGCASFLIDHVGRVVRYNEPAQKLLGDGLELSRGVLRCTQPADNPSLAALIASQCAASFAKPGSRQVVVARRSGKRPLIIRAVSLSGLSASIFGAATTVLLVSDSEGQRTSTPPDTLMKAFGLTRTEAVLVSHLEQDMAVSDVADVMNIAFETARTHLKRVLAKTQTRRQQDLLMLLQRIK